MHLVFLAMSSCIDVKEFKHTVKVHCGNLLYETIAVSADLNLTDLDMQNLTEAAKDTAVDKYHMLLKLLKDTGCDDQVCTQFQDKLTPLTNGRYEYQDRNGSTYDQYMLFLANQGSVSIFLNTGTGS